MKYTTDHVCWSLTHTTTHGLAKLITAGFSKLLR